jgi:hypothetical protein
MGWHFIDGSIIIKHIMLYPMKRGIRITLVVIMVKPAVKGFYIVKKIRQNFSFLGNLMVEKTKRNRDRNG